MNEKEKLELLEQIEHMDDIEEIEVVDAQERGKFAKGVIAGVLSTICIFLLIGAACIFWLQGRISTGGNNGAQLSAGIVNNTVRAKVNDLVYLIQNYYYEDVDAQKLTDGLYKGLFESLEDPYSAYYTKEEYEDMMISASAKYYGIGAVMQQDKETMQVKIAKVYDGSPADRAGLKAGDILIRVGNISARSMELSELVTYVRGEENTKVHLQIQRQGEPDYLEFDVKRARVDVPTVDGQMLTDEIGYIMISEFGEATAQDFEDKVEKLQDDGMKKMIVDLRDNPGGMLDSVTEILDYILPEGLIVYTEDKQGNRKEEKSDGERFLDCPMAVLINGNSASCSEIFAGAIRDYDYGTLIGTTTYGKGVVQTVRPLADKSAIKLTTAKYFTPKGENIQGTGIRPDIELKYKYTGKTGGDYDYSRDNQVKKAIRVLEKEQE